MLVVDLGLVLIAAGFLRPPLAVLGLVVFLIGLWLPARPFRFPGSPMAGLDAVIPSYEFGEHHEIVVRASPSVVYAAVLAVTAREIRFFRLLTFVRAPHLGQAPESILNPDPDRPIVDVATRTMFLLLHEEPDREVVLGALLPPGSQTKPGSAAEFLDRRGSFSRAAMNFHLTPQPDGTTRLVTETRIAASDAAARRKFAAYWRLIYPGSAFIRHQWLRAIRRRAESQRRPPLTPGATKA